MKRHRFLVYFEMYLTPIIQFVRNISSILQTWQNDRRLFVFWFHQKSFTTICELLWMPTTESILSSRLRSVPPCRLRPPVLSDHICLAHWVVVIYRFYCICFHRGFAFKAKPVRNEVMDSLPWIMNFFCHLWRNLQIFSIHHCNIHEHKCLITSLVRKNV